MSDKIVSAFVVLKPSFFKGASTCEGICVSTGGVTGGLTGGLTGVSPRAFARAFLQFVCLPGPNPEYLFVMATSS
ncbi:hypothetical protein PBCV1_a294R [Paramecium bursaria Chlorella virus 1]|uniref:Uncharacterized protein n=1 Tax=Paramecium bursaria Chlorella virus 1 TaxID=10506 RepID=Q84610_PBCV1|nr:hypothetical protein PBCV1_a294R [Paramecium bursaria Chlorella virus 1]AAC96662.1 hypothetical protein [Paramecium bursaria Chlorella virus 1]